MSYEIIYDRQFIRTTRGIIPMILSGSNNCTEFTWDARGRTHERRERRWWAWVPGKLMTKDHSEKEYMNEISLCQDGSDRQMCKFRNRWLTLDQWGKWFHNGCRAAVTLEDCFAFNPIQSFTGCLRIYPASTEFAHTEEMFQYLHTTAELEAWLDAANTRAKKAKEEYGDASAVYILLEFTRKEPLYKVSRAECEVMVKREHQFVSHYENGERLKRLTYTSNPEDACVFANAQEALKEIGNTWDHLKIVKAEPQLRKKTYVLMLQHGTFAERYISRKRGGYLHTTSLSKDAIRFTSPKAAIRYARETKKRYPIGPTILVINLADKSKEKVNLEDIA